MTVYIVLTREEYSGDCIEGVYTNEDAAKEELLALAKQYQYTWDKKYSTWRYGATSLVVEEFDVYETYKQKMATNG